MKGQEFRAVGTDVELRFPVQELIPSSAALTFTRFPGTSSRELGFRSKVCTKNLLQSQFELVLGRTQEVKKS